MIPKVIHYCWFGRGPKSPLNLRCIASWRQWMPEYALKEWNEDNAPLDVPFMREAQRHGLWSKMSNYVRHHALWGEGGIYFDTDVQVVRPFDPLLDRRMFLGFQVKEQRSDWVNDSVMGAVAGHPLNRRYLELTTGSLSEDRRFPLSPSVLTHALIERGLRDYGRQDLGDIALYPTEFFYPHSWEEAFDPSCVTPDTFCIHHWTVSWRAHFERYERKTRLASRIRRRWNRLTRRYRDR